MASGRLGRTWLSRAGRGCGVAESTTGGRPGEEPAVVPGWQTGDRTASGAGGAAPVRPVPGSDRQLARDAGVVLDQRRVRPDRRAVGQLRDPGEQPRRQRRAVDAGRLGLARSRARPPRGRPLRQRGLRRHRHADEDPAAEPEAQVRRDEPRGRRPRPARDCGARRPARPGVEARQLVLADRHDRHAARLEELERSPARRGSPSGRRTRRPSASGRAPRGRTRCRGEGRPGPPNAPRWTPPIPPVAKTRIPAACAAIIVAETVVAAQPPRASAAARLGRAALSTRPGGRRRERLERRVVEPDEQPAVADGHGRRHRPGRRTAASEAGATSRFARVRQAVADQRRLERDDGPPGRERGRDLRPRPRAGSEGPPVIRRGPAQARLREQLAGGGPVPAPVPRAGATPRASARRTGRRSQPTRKPASNASPAPVVSVGVDVLRRDLEAEPLPVLRAPARRALRAALDDRDRREVEQPLDAVAAQERLGLGTVAKRTSGAASRTSVERRAPARRRAAARSTRGRA